ncbi:MAG: N-succinylarginine dihydrolase, partial [Phycisphaerales bacterium]
MRGRLRRVPEVNFDGIVGPTHNYAGLSRGNVA